MLIMRIQILVPVLLQKFAKLKQLDTVLVCIRRCSYELGSWQGAHDVGYLADREVAIVVQRTQ